MKLIKIRENRVAKFISVRDFLNGLAEYENCQLSEAASEFLVHIGTEQDEFELNPDFIYLNPKNKSTHKLHQDLMWILLKHVVDTGSYDGCFYYKGGFLDTADGDTPFDSYGWFREEMSRFFEIGIGIARPPPFICQESEKYPWLNLVSSQATAPSAEELRANSSELEAAKNRIAELEKMQHEYSVAKESSDESAAVFSIDRRLMTNSLIAVFKIMESNWKNYDPKRLPKQIQIAYEIDEALGWGGKGNKEQEPTRSAKAIAAIIKPDALRDTD